MALSDLSRRPHPLVGVGRRHPDVDDRDVGRVAAHLEQEVVRGARLAGDLEAGPLQQLRDALPEENRVVCDHDAHTGHRRNSSAIRMVLARGRVSIET